MDYCADLGQSFVCSDRNGTATSFPLLPGVVDILVFPRDNHLEVDTTATVVSGQNTSLTLAVVPGATITTTVRNSKTGAPVRGTVVLNADLFLSEPANFFYVNSPHFEHATPIKVQQPGPIIANIGAPPLS